MQHISVRTDKPERKTQKEEGEYTWLDEFLKEHPDVTVGDVLEAVEDVDEEDKGHEDETQDKEESDKGDDFTPPDGSEG